MTRDEVLKIEDLSQEEKEGVEKDGKFLTRDLKICFIHLLNVSKAALDSGNPTHFPQLLETMKGMKIIANGVPVGVEMSFFQIFQEKFKKLQSLFEDKNIELRPTTEILEGWARILAYIQLTEEPYSQLSKTVRRMNELIPMLGFDQIAKFCQNLSNSLAENRKGIRIFAETLAEHDKPNSGAEVLAELDALTAKQKEKISKMPMDSSKTP